jgi:RND family efflux transporter MFP subunit
MKPAFTVKSALVALAVMVAAMPASDVALGQGGPMPVTVANPVERDITETADFTGRFRPSAFVQITSSVTGYLQEARFTEGAFVNKGDTLLVIDPRPFQAAVDQATAQLKVAQTKLDLARTNLNRSQELRRTGNVTDAIFQANQQAFLESQATIDAAAAALASARLDLEFSAIKAPISGRISRKLVTEGNLVVANSTTPLTTIVATDPLYFYFDIDETSYLAYQRENGGADGLRSLPGDMRAAFIALPDETSFTHPGLLDYVDPEIDASTGSAGMRAVVKNADGALAPGLFGRIRVKMKRPYQAFVVPDAAVGRSAQGTFVMISSADGTVGMKPVETGPKFGEFRVVRKGLEASDLVIINGLMRARPGGKVILQKTELKVPEDLSAGSAKPGPAPAGE